MKRVSSFDTVHVIAPNFKRRLSGVTSTIIQLVPLQNHLGQKVAVLGPGLPDRLPHIRFRDLWKLWIAPQGAPHRIWHARRNNEMLTGILLKYVLRMRLKLLFTSAAQRNHKPFTKWMIRRMDKIVATSAKSAAYLNVPNTVVRHGVDLAMFRPADANAAETASPCLPGRFLAGCFGRVRHQKGTDLFVRAMVDLLPNYPDWTAVVCGRVTAEHKAFGESLKTLVSDAGLSNRILFLGEVDDIKPWYRRLSLYVAPSRNEGFGLTPLEAMACAVPVVASDAGAYAEMIVPGVTGEVTPAGEYEFLKAAIEGYLSNPARTAAAAEAALQHVTANFALDNEANGLAEVYHGLLASD